MSAVSYLAAGADPDRAPLAIRELFGVVARELGDVSGGQAESILRGVVQSFCLAVEMQAGRNHPVYLPPIRRRDKELQVRLVPAIYAQIDATWPGCKWPSAVGALLADSLADIACGRAELPAEGD